MQTPFPPETAFTIAAERTRRVKFVYVFAQTTPARSLLTILKILLPLSSTRRRLVHMACCSRARSLPPASETS